MLGLDLSLSSPAAVAIPRGWRVGDWSTLTTLTFRTSAPDAPAGSSYEKERIARLQHISDRMLSFARCVKAETCWVEDYGYSKRSSSVTKLAELGGVVRVDFLRVGLVVRPLTASTCRTLLLGKLPRSDQKIAVQNALFAAGAPKEWNEDTCDALVVANGARAEQGLLFLSLA